MPFTLKELAYAKNALVPHISEEALDLHHGKHLQTYVNNTNNLITGTEFENLSLDEIILKSKQGPLFNNSAQIWNHEFFFNCLSPNGGGAPTGNVAAAIESNFTNFETFKDKFTKTSVGQFGSGWAWLVKDADGKLDVLSTSNAGTPLLDGKKPLLVLDVWEHSYYVDYRNRRPEYIEHFFELINWDFVAKQM